MFQIFAARMFEQRVLTAYREKVAAERQAKLLQELEEEDRLDTQREARKAREAAKKKEKKKAQKQAKDEEKAKRDADKLAQEAAVREAEEKKLEEQRQRKEEQRKKREADRKAAEEERLKKEAEKLRRVQEQKERQAETERKQREAKERDRLKKEESKKKEREERDAREKEARERKAKEADERKAKEDQARKDKEAAIKETRSQHPPRAQPVALPPGLHPPLRGTQIQSPSFPIATPVVPPKVPTPVRNRQPSHPGPQTQSHGSSPRSQKTGTELSSASPASVAMPQTPAQTAPNKTQGQPPLLHHPQPNAPRSPLNNPGRNQYAFNMNGLPGLGVSGAPMNGSGMMPGMMPQMPQMPPMYQGPPMGNPRYGPNGMQYPPNFPGPRHFQPGQPIPFQPQAPGAAPSQPPQTKASKAPHSRQPSGSTTTEASSQPAPIARPGPIGRPASTTPDRQKTKKSPDQEVEQITTALGSKALLDDSDEPIPPVADRSNVGSLGAPGTGRLPFASTFADAKQPVFGGGQSWGGFSPAPGWGAPGSQPSSGAWPQQPFGSLSSAPQPMHRPHLSRPVAVRVLLAQACRQLSAGNETWHPTPNVLQQVNMMKSPTEPPVSMEEMLGLSETEGSPQNGGGSFEVSERGRGQVIKFAEDSAPPRSSVGDIGSPLPSHSQPIPFPIGQSAFGPPGRGF